MGGTQGTTLLEGEKSFGPRPVVDLDELDLHLSVLASSKGDHHHHRHLPEPVSAATTPPGLDTHLSIHTGPPTSKGTPRTESEIIVRIDDMDSDMNSPLSGSASHDDIE